MSDEALFSQGICPKCGADNGHKQCARIGRRVMPGIAATPASQKTAKKPPGGIPIKK